MPQSSVRSAEDRGWASWFTYGEANVVAGFLPTSPDWDLGVL
jgi:hypothetical protein